MSVSYLKTAAMPKVTYRELHKCLAYHAAGQVASIYRGNKQKGLPFVFFRIFKKPFISESSVVHYLNAPRDNFIADVEGGRLIRTLPPLLAEQTKDFTFAQKQFYEKAFEADVANILAGPLAEAKYVAQRDDETITARLVNLKALTFYHGASEVDLVSRYFECINLSENEKEKKIVDIYFDSFSFLSEYGNWSAITRLAGYILESDKSVIESDEAIAVIDTVAA